jgi:hypothetical protein
VSRLDKIVARNRRPPWHRNPVVLAFAIAAVVIVTLALAVMTQLGRPKTSAAPPAPATGSDVQRVDNVLLRRH